MNDPFKNVYRVDRLVTKMKKKGLVKAKAKCKDCEGYWRIRLVGPKKHLRLYCDGTCKFGMMS